MPKRKYAYGPTPWAKRYRRARPIPMTRRAAMYGRRYAKAGALAIRRANPYVSAAAGAATLIGMAYRRYRNRRKRITGARPTTSVTHDDFLFGLGRGQQGSWNRKRLNWTLLTMMNPPRNNEAVTPVSQRDNIRSANSTKFFVKGIKICGYIRNEGEIPVRLHMAIIQPKREYINAEITQNDMEQEFFVDHNGPNSWRNFENFNVEPQVDRYQDCSGINKSKWNIFTHKKFLLAPGFGIGDGGQFRQFELPNTNNMKVFDDYYKVGKTFQYKWATTPLRYSLEKPLILVTWYDWMGKEDTVIDSDVVKFNLNSKCVASPIPLN